MFPSRLTLRGFESVSKRPNLCRNDSYIFEQEHVSVSKLHCVEIARNF